MVAATDRCEPLPRVVSLVPSVTETLLAWGTRPVACTRFCEQPGIEHVGGTKNPDVARIAALRPDLVVLDEEENRRQDFEALRAAGLEVLALAVRSLADVAPALGLLAERLGLPAAVPPPAPIDRGGPGALAGEAGPGGTARVRAFVPIWRRPWMALGQPTYGASLLEALGIESAFAAEGPYPAVTLEEAARRRPDVVLAPSEPYPFTKRQLPELAPVAPTVFVDGKDLFWWGARSPVALQRLESVLRAAGLLLAPGIRRRISGENPTKASEQLHQRPEPPEREVPS